MRLSCLVFLSGFFLTAGCGGFSQKFEQSFDKSFRESCRSGAVKKGATPALAEQYCECALVKFKETKSMDKAAEVCVAQVKSNPVAPRPVR